MIAKLRSWSKVNAGNGINGEFFCKVADELVRLQNLSDSRLENIKAMSSYLDDVAEALGVPKPGTPVEGIGACWNLMAAIRRQKAVIEKISRVASGEDQVADDDTEGMEWIRRFIAESV